jgi:hypothetical protein
MDASHAVADRCRNRPHGHRRLNEAGWEFCGGTTDVRAFVLPGGCSGYEPRGLRDESVAGAE